MEPITESHILLNHLAYQMCLIILWHMKTNLKDKLI